MRFLPRLFRSKTVSPSKMTAICRSQPVDDEMHKGFKTKPGRGPFLLSYDGRVIPLRKARFLHRH